MALNPAPMIQGFTQLFTSGNPATPQDSARQMAAIYDQYAQPAMAGIALPIFTGAEKQALEALLLAAIAVPMVGLPPTIAAAWATGLVSYWSAPPIACVGATAVGAVTLAAGCLSAVPTLTAVFANPANTPASAAAQIAAALDTATRTVLVTLITTSVPPVTLVVPLI